MPSRTPSGRAYPIGLLFGNPAAQGTTADIGRGKMPDIGVQVYAQPVNTAPAVSQAKQQAASSPLIHYQGPRLGIFGQVLK